MRRLLGLAWDPDMAVTFHDVYADTRRRHGRFAAAAVALAEITDLIRAGLRRRLGLKTPISSGWQPPARRQGRGVMQKLWSDLRLAVRTLTATRVTTTIAVATLALGIGVSTALFSMLDSMLFRPLPFQQPQQLFEIWSVNAQQFSFPRLSRALLLEWRKQTDVFERVEGYEIESAIYEGPKGAEMVAASYVTPGLMPLLGVGAMTGRTFVDGDGRDGTDDRVVISERFWRETLQRDPSVIGRRLTLNGRPHEIVGVMPASFYFPNQPQLLWLPLDVDQPPARRLKGAMSLTAFARLRADVDPAAAAVQVGDRGGALNAAAGGRPGLTARLTQPKQFIDTRTRQSLYILAGAVAFLLLIVCANIANLSLSRALGRSRDLAVRASLGASRGDLVRHALIESLVLGVTGAALGVLVAWVTMRLGASMLPASMTFATVNAIDLDARVLMFASGLGVLTPLLFGLPPALVASRPNVMTVLRQDTRASAGSPTARRLRSLLVVGEVTVAIVLLTGTALLARSLYQLHSIDRGFDTAGLIALRVGLPANGYIDPYERDRFTDDLMTRIQREAGVVAVTAGGVPPDSSQISWGKIELADNPGTLSDKELIFPIYTAWPGYFDALGLRLKEGRDFAHGDTANEVVISEAFARDYWPGRSAVGAQFRFAGGKTWKTVIGVATDVRQFDLDDANGAYEWFQPLRTPPGRTAPATPDAMAAIVDYRTIAVRATDAAALIPRLPALVHEVDRRVVIWETDLVDDMFSQAIERPRVLAVALAIFGGLGLILAAAGLYGVLTHQVAQRLREFGIRVALGARPAAVFGAILRSGLTLTIVGLVMGLASAMALSRFLGTLLYQVDQFDPLSLSTVTLVLLLAAVVACWVPARRAMRADPVSLLRES